VTVAYNKDPSPVKLNLGVGAYRTEVSFFFLISFWIKLCYSSGNFCWIVINIETFLAKMLLFVCIR
jgi:hypothetical protein